jgi:hypothetical protein
MIDRYTIATTIVVIAFNVWWLMSIIIAGKIFRQEPVHPAVGVLLSLVVIVCLTITLYIVAKIDEERKRFTSVKVLARRG